MQEIEKICETNFLILTIILVALDIILCIIGLVWASATYGYCSRNFSPLLIAIALIWLALIIFKGLFVAGIRVPKCGFASARFLVPISSILITLAYIAILIISIIAWYWWNTGLQCDSLLTYRVEVYLIVINVLLLVECLLSFAAGKYKNEWLES